MRDKCNQGVQPLVLVLVPWLLMVFIEALVILFLTRSKYWQGRA